MRIIASDYKLAYPKVVLFDWDNTLVDSLPLVLESIVHTFAAFGRDMELEEDIGINMHKSARDILSIYFPGNEAKADEIFKAKYASLKAEIKPFDSAEAALKELSRLNICTAIVSNKRSIFLRDEVTALNWDKYFQIILGSGDSAEDKPSGIPVQNALKGMKQHDIPREHIWFVGDSHVDMKAAYNSGCVPVLFSATEDLGSVYQDCMPKVQLNSYQTLLSYLANALTNN